MVRFLSFPAFLLLYSFSGQKVVPNAGMPIPSCPGEFGNLIIDIDVEKVYSSWLRDPQIRKRIREALPPIEDQGEQIWKCHFYELIFI